MWTFYAVAAWNFANCFTRLLTSIRFVPLPLRLRVIRCTVSSKYLLKNTITIIPPMGYTPKARQSLIAHKWLSYLSEKNDVYIQHARDGGEKRVGDYSLDGYCEEIHTAFEFHGCFWHGELFFSFIYILGTKC